MDNLTWIVLAALMALIFFRLRRSLRKARMNSNKEEEIRTRLRELRKKRDEE